MQKFYGKEIWASTLYDDLKQQSVKYNTNGESYNIVIDDWRREIESDYLIRQGDFNVIKIYLDKDGKSAKLSKSSAAYEGQIDPKTCNIVFKYTKTYSNFEELIELIKNELK